MEFSIKTTYDQSAMAAVARALRKTLRKKRSRRSHILGWIVVLFGALLLFSQDSFGIRQLLTAFAMILIIFVEIWEDRINGYFARKRGLPGLDTSLVTFHETGYHSETALGSSDFYYDSILRITEYGDYIIFIFSINHGQVYDKRSLTGGTIQDFKLFLIEKTGKNIESI